MKDNDKRILKALVLSLPCGIYALVSILDAMFYTITGLSFFVGNGGPVRVLLTMFDLILAIIIFMWRTGAFE